MSFFKDFKDDLSLAVNELLPGEDLENEDDMEESSEMMVNTLEGELDLESELSKLDGLLEHVDAPEEVKHVQIEPEEPVLEQLPDYEPKPSSSSKNQAVSAAPKMQQAPEMTVSQKNQPATPRSKEKPKEPGLVKDFMNTSMNSNSANNSSMNRSSMNTSDTSNNSSMNGSISNSMDEAISRLSSVFDLDQNKEDEVHFSFDALAEEADPEPLRHTAEPVVRNVYPNNRNMKTSTTIKEEVPMNEEMMKEAAMAMEEELSADTPEITDEVSIITTGTNIKGNLSTTGSFSISGRVEGNVQCNGKLEVTGVIKGNSSASEVFSDAAKVEGEITSTGTVKIGLGSVVVGNIAATSAVIAGAVKGDIDVQGPVVVDTSAVIVGNIKSRSVQINNGAVIEGFCSQCYADIDVDSLFGEAKKGK